MLRNTVNYRAYITILSSCFVILVSCKKDRLVDDKEVLVGTWNWDYSVRTNQQANNWQADYIDTLTPLNTEDSYKMEFCKNGKIHFYKNGEITEKKRLVTWFWDKDDDKEFTFKLNNDSKILLEGSLYRNDFNGIKDTLVTWRYFPFKGGENCRPTYEDCFYTHYFIKEQ